VKEGSRDGAGREADRAAHKQQGPAVDPHHAAPLEPALGAGRDALLSFALVCPLVATFWRGCWVMLDCWLPADPAQAAAVSVALGGLLVGLAHAANLPQPAGEQLTITEGLRERGFSYVLAWSGVFVWHGIWQGWEVLTGDGLASGVACHMLGLGGLLALRSFRSTLAPPACVALDDDPAYGAVVPTLRTALLARHITSLWER